MKQAASTSIWATWPVMACQAQVIFNDNASKLILVGLIQVIMPEEQIPIWVAALTALVILPYLALSPLCGWIADRYSKRTVLLVSVWAQLLIMLFLIACCIFREPMLASFTFFLLAVQSTLMAPAKQGILKELVGSEGLGRAVGWMEMLTMAGILVGSYFGGWIFDEATRWAQGSVWNGALWSCSLLTVGCVASQAIIYLTPKVKAQATGETFRLSLLFSHFHDISFVARHRKLWLASLGVAYFYAMGFFIYLIILQVGREAFAGSSEAARLSGWLYGVMGMGIAVGSMTAAYLSRHRLELGIVPIGGAGFPLAMLMLYFVTGSGAWFQAGLFLLGVCGGFFVVPLYAYLQDESEDDKRGRVLAATNVMINVCGVGALVLQGVMSGYWKYTVQSQLLACAFFTAVFSFLILYLLPDALVRFLIIFHSQLFYRFTAYGREHIPRKGGVLLVCNHVSYIDTIPLQWACPRPIRFMAWEGFFQNPMVGAALRMMKAVPISRTKAKDSIKNAVDRLKDGEVVCIFPEGQLTRTGELMGFRKGFELIARRADVPVLPAHLDSLWWSIFAYGGGSYFFKVPKRLPFPVTVSFGEPFSARHADAMIVREKVQELCAEAFARRKELDQSAGLVMIRSLLEVRDKSRIRVYRDDDSFQIYTGREVLSLAQDLADKIRAHHCEEVVLNVEKPFLMYLAQIAAALADCPMLIPTKEGLSNEWLDERKIRLILSDFQSSGAWAAENRVCLDLNDWFKNSRKRGGNFLSSLVPTSLWAWWKGVPKMGGNRACLEFVSNRHPQGLKLTHRQWIANLAQIHSTHAFWPKDRVLSGLDWRTPYGSMVSIWVPLVSGTEMIFPARCDVASWVQTMAESEPSVLCVDESSFGRLAEAKPESIKKLRMLLVGPEPLSSEFQESCKKGEICPMQVWGSDQIPVVSLNMPDPNNENVEYEPQVGNFPGSMGRLLPGIAARIVSPESGAVQSPLEEGKLQLSSASHAEEAGEGDALNWFDTGFRGRFDEEGFLFITVAESGGEGDQTRTISPKGSAASTEWKGPSALET